ncbi:hypothetical protein ACLOJK_038280 [Asimina triloba]
MTDPCRSSVSPSSVDEKSSSAAPSAQICTQRLASARAPFSPVPTSPDLPSRVGLPRSVQPQNPVGLPFVPPVVNERLPICSSGTSVRQPASCPSGPDPALHRAQFDGRTSALIVSVTPVQQLALDLPAPSASARRPTTGIGLRSDAVENPSASRLEVATHLLVGRLSINEHPATCRPFVGSPPFAACRRPSAAYRHCQPPPPPSAAVWWSLLFGKKMEHRMGCSSGAPNLVNPQTISFGTPLVDDISSGPHIHQSTVGLTSVMGPTSISQSMTSAVSPTSSMTSAVDPTSVSQAPLGCSGASGHICYLSASVALHSAGCAYFGKGVRLFTSVYISLAHMYGGGDL